MINKIFLFICATILLIGSVSAWTNTTFNNSLSSEFLNYPFNGNNSYVRYLAVPQGTHLTSGSINLTYPTMSQTLISNLKLYYDFSSKKELVSGIYNLTANEGTAVYNASNCLIGNCTQLSTNVNVMIPVNNFTVFNGSSSINFWVRLTNSASGPVFLSPQGTVGRMATQNQTSWLWNSWVSNGSSNMSGRTPVMNNSFFMITMTRNDSNGNVSIYVNNQLEIAGMGGGVNETGFKYWLLGVNFNNGSELNGQIDELGVWNTTLTQADISTLYQGGTGLNSALLFPFDGETIGNLTVTVGNNVTILQTSNISLGTGGLNGSTILGGLHSAINSYLATCTIIGGFCNVPFNFTTFVDNAFVLYNNLNFANTGLIENSQNFSNQTIEGALERFTINVTYDPSYFPSASATLIYNGVSYTGNQVTSTPDTLFYRDIFIPGVTGNTVYNFSWSFALSNRTDILSFNSTTKNQTVQNIDIDTCGSYTNRILNFTVRDEQYQTFLPNATIETAVNIYNLDRSSLILNVSGNYTNPVSICLSVALTNTTTYVLDTVAKYSEVNHASEYYNIVNTSLNGNYTTQNIPLFDLNSSDSTEFQFSFTGTDFLAVAGALVYLDRQYIPENVFKTVELPITDVNGQTILHMVRNDLKYNIRVYKDGVLLGNFLNIVPFCQDFTIGSCSISLSAAASTNTTFDYNKATGLQFSAPVYDSNASTISTTFVTIDGTAKLVTMNVTRSDVFGNQSVCSNSLTSASGTLSCIVPAGTADTTLIVSIYTSGVLVGIVNIILSSNNFGQIGFVAWFVLSLFIILIFGESKNGMLIGIALSYVGGVLLMFSNGTIFGIASGGIWILINTVLGLWRINRDRPQ